MPELDPIGVIFWRAFETLNRQRVINKYGPQPIPVSEILAYADLAGIEDRDDREDLLHHVTALDGVWLKVAYEKKRKEEKKAAQKQKQEASRRRRR